MSEWSGSIPELLFTYVQNNEPTDIEEGQTWYDLDSDTVYVFTDGTGAKTEFTVVDHSGLAGIGPADHHNPVTVSNPLVEDGSQGLSLSLANALTVSGGSLAVVESSIALANLSDYPVGTGDLAFDTATQAELDSHESDPDAHHNPVTVSAPLTRSQQALALALGNALTLDGNNDLAVDESAISHDSISGVSDADHHDPVTVSAPLTRSGQSLGVDQSAISLSNLAGYPVETSDLGFNTATQADLSTHAGDAAVHHSPPSETQSVSESVEWVEVASGFPPDSQQTVTLPQPATKFRVTGSHDGSEGTAQTASLYDTANGSDDFIEGVTVQPNETNTATFGITSNEKSGVPVGVVKVDTRRAVTVDSLEISVVRTSHNHQI